MKVKQLTISRVPITNVECARCFHTVISLNPLKTNAEPLFSNLPILRCFLCASICIHVKSTIAFTMWQLSLDECVSFPRLRAPEAMLSYGYAVTIFITIALHNSYCIIAINTIDKMINSFYREGRRAVEKLSNWPKVTQLIIVRAIDIKVH